MGKSANGLRPHYAEEVVKCVRMGACEGETPCHANGRYTLESLSDSAITWFFVGLMLIAAIAAVLGQVVIS